MRTLATSLIILLSAIGGELRAFLPRPDPDGRRTRTLNADGTTTAVEFDPWDRATAITTLTAEGETAGSETIDYTAAGRIEEITTVIDDSPTAGENRTTQFRWDGAGRTTRSATGERVSVSSFDLAGRIQSAAYGRGSIAGLAETFTATGVSQHKGYWPEKVSTTEKDAAAPIEETRQFDVLGNPVSRKVGPLTWSGRFDEAGNVLAAALPNRPEAEFERDARGAVTTETQPDAATLKYAYDPLGAMGIGWGQVWKTNQWQPRSAPAIHNTWRKVGFPDLAPTNPTNRRKVGFPDLAPTNLGPNQSRQLCIQR